MAKKDRISLESALITLQKSFSRVSRESSKVKEDKAQALIVGNVTFELEFNADVEDDHIYLNDEGTVRMKFNGDVETDIRISEDNKKGGKQDE